MRVLPYGERAVLAEVDDPRLVPAVRAAMALSPTFTFTRVVVGKALLIRTGPSCPAPAISHSFCPISRAAILSLAPSECTSSWEKAGGLITAPMAVAS